MKPARQCKKNNLLSSSNLKQDAKKEIDLKELELLTIPALEKQINKEEGLRDELIKTIEKTQKLSNDAFSQAEQISPSSAENLFLFKTNLDEPKVQELSSLVTFKITAI